MGATMGIEHRVFMLAINEKAANLAKEVLPKARVLYHSALTAMIENVGQTITVDYPTRIAKLVGASLLVERGFKVVVSDLDMHWSRDISLDLMRLNEDVVACRDVCSDELNSGLV